MGVATATATQASRVRLPVIPEKIGINATIHRKNSSTNDVARVRAPAHRFASALAPPPTSAGSFVAEWIKTLHLTQRSQVQSPLKAEKNW